MALTGDFLYAEFAFSKHNNTLFFPIFSFCVFLFGNFMPQMVMIISWTFMCSHQLLYRKQQDTKYYQKTLYLQLI